MTDREALEAIWAQYNAFKSDHRAVDIYNYDRVIDNFERAMDLVFDSMEMTDD